MKIGFEAGRETIKAENDIMFGIMKGEAKKHLDKNCCIFERCPLCCLVAQLEKERRRE